MSYKRGLGKNNADVSLKELYKNYKLKSKNPVSYKIYASFLKEYNERIIHAIIYNNLEFKMPFKLGSIRIQKRKLTPYIKEGELIKKHLSPDWKRTREYWAEKYPGLTTDELKEIPSKKVLLHHNDHSNGYSVRFYWDKRISNVKHQTSYIYKATRTTKEELAKFIKKTGILDYFE